MEEKMYRKFLVFIMVIGILLAGCARSEPEVEDPNEDPYPVPQPTTPVSPDDPDGEPYPGPQPITPDEPMPVPYPEPGGGYEGPILPQPGDEDLERGEVFIDTFTLLTMESFPPQFALIIRGNLPTPCHELRAKVADPDEQNRIMVETYSLFDPEEICITVLQPFEVSISLGSFPDGDYSVYVDDELVAEFSSP
jgi:hypothetical protein